MKLTPMKVSIVIGPNLATVSRTGFLERIIKSNNALLYREEALYQGLFQAESETRAVWT